MAHGGKSTGSKGSSKPGFGQKRTSGGVQKGKKEKAPATNPFNMRFNKPKMVVDGQKIKGIRSNLGQSRTKAIENVSDEKSIDHSPCQRFLTVVGVIHDNQNDSKI